MATLINICKNYKVSADCAINGCHPVSGSYTDYAGTPHFITYWYCKNCFGAKALSDAKIALDALNGIGDGIGG